jgi:hypothetical protein
LNSGYFLYLTGGIMDKNRTVNQMSGRDETLAQAFYSDAGHLTAPRVARFGYSAPRHKVLRQVSAKLGGRLNAPLSKAHQALLADEAKQSAEDIALAERMARVQCDSLAS